MKFNLFGKKELRSPKIKKFLWLYVFDDSPEFRKLVEKKVKEINQSSELPFNLLIPHDDFIEKYHGEMDRFENFMSNDYCTHKWSLEFSGYPNDECDMFLTKTTVDLDEYSVFGINDNTTVEEAESILADYGFIYTSQEYKNFLGEIRTDTYYKYLDIKIYLHTKDDKIPSLTLEVRTYYVGNRIY